MVIKIKIPKYIEQKINKIADIKKLQDKLEMEIVDWLKSKNIDTDDDEIVNGLLAKISYGEITIQEIEEGFKNYIKTSKFIY